VVEKKGEIFASWFDLALTNFAVESSIGCATWLMFKAFVRIPRFARLSAHS
jgi:hypothetical protein